MMEYWEERIERKMKEALILTQKASAFLPINPTFQHSNIPALIRMF